MSKCIQCGIEYTKKGNAQKYCSFNCQYDAKLRDYKKKWAQENKEKTDLSKKRYLENHPERRKKSSSEYRKRNKPYYAQYASLRSRYVEQAKPKWVDENDLLDIYKEAEYMQLEVDHMIPIKHPQVCGLHVPWNLQLLSREANAKKSNKFLECYTT